MHDGSIYFVQKLKFNLEWNVLSGASTIHWSLWRIWRSMTSSDFQGMSSWIFQPQWAEHFFRASFKKISCSILSKWWLQYFFFNSNKCRFQHLKPFTCNGEFFTWMKNSRVGWKPQTNKHPFSYNYKSQNIMKITFWSSDLRAKHWV